MFIKYDARKNNMVVSGDLRYKVFVIAILHCHKYMHYRCLKK